jgi:hypothetical protein
MRRHIHGSQSKEVNIRVDDRLLAAMRVPDNDLRGAAGLAIGVRPDDSVAIDVTEHRL